MAPHGCRSRLRTRPREPAASQKREDRSLVSLSHFLLSSVGSLATLLATRLASSIVGTLAVFSFLNSEYEMRLTGGAQMPKAPHDHSDFDWLVKERSRIQNLSLELLTFMQTNPPTLRKKVVRAEVTMLMVGATFSL